MDSSSSFGYWVRRRRKALDLTQGELAQRVGCVVTTTRKVEADARRPSRELAERLADILQVAAEERATFLKAARAELAVDRLPLDHQLPPPSTEPTAPAQPTVLPTGTLTFLFTDIEGSTMRWDQQTEAMAAIRARLDAAAFAAAWADGRAMPLERATAEALGESGSN